MNIKRTRLSVMLLAAVMAVSMLLTCGYARADAALRAADGGELSPQTEALPELPEKAMMTKEEYGDWVANKGIWLSKVNDESANSAVKISIDPAAETVKLRGWALDFWNDAPVSELYLQVGDTIFSCEYGLEQQDVVDRLGKEEMRDCGFQVVFPAELLQTASDHTVSFISISADGEYRYEPVSYQIVGALPDLPEKAMITKEEYGDWVGNKGIWLSKVNGENVDNAEKVEAVPADGMVELRGWALDFWNDAPVSELYLQVGERFLLCDYGAERADVVDRFGKEELLDCGFAVSIPADMLGEEVQEVSFIGVSADGTNLYEPVTYGIIISQA